MHEDIIWKEVSATIGFCIDCGALLLYLAHIGLVPSSQIGLPIATLYIATLPIVTLHIAHCHTVHLHSNQHCIC